MTSLENDPLDLDQLERALAEMRQSFDHLEENPQLTHEALNLLTSALERLEDACALVRHAPSDEGLGHARAYLETVVGIRAGYQKAIYSGPAFHPFLNRTLLQMGHFFRGGTTRTETDHLLLGLPDFVHQLSLALTEVRDLKARASIEAHLGDVVSDCQAFREWLDTPELAALERIQLSLLHHSQNLTLELTAQLEANLLQGPTTWTPANMVSMAVDRFLAGSLDKELLLEAVAQVERLLDFRISSGAEPILLAAVDDVRAALTRVSQEPAAARDDFVERTRTMLEVAASLAPEDSKAVLPPLLASLYKLGEDFLGRAVPASRLEGGVQKLELVVRKAGQRGEAIEQLELAAFCLRKLASSRLNTDLEAGRQAMLSASIHLPASLDADLQESLEGSHFCLPGLAPSEELAQGVAAGRAGFSGPGLQSSAPQAEMAQMINLLVRVLSGA